MLGADEKASGLVSKVYNFPPALFLFFFQAEDGIRDPLVTGVQTCALPIYEADWAGGHPPGGVFGGAQGGRGGIANSSARRSEERRVGKECRYRWAAYQ